MGILITILAFLLLISLLVYVHELGHFITARLFRMRVDEFGFGFPPRLFGVYKTARSFKWVWGTKPDHVEGKTIFSINAVPLGGFVRIFGENNDARNVPGAFTSKSKIQRFIVLVSGCAMNWILAWVIISIGLIVGYPAVIDVDHIPAGSTVSTVKVLVQDVEAGKPAAVAGLKVGDQIVSVDGSNISTSQQLHDYVHAHAGSRLTFSVIREGQKQDYNVLSNQVTGPDQGPTGIAPVDVGYVRFAWWKAPQEGFFTTIQMTKAMVAGIYNIFAKQDFSQVGGPVRIAEATGVAFRTGASDFLQLLSLISINLALINLLPIPALDGGRILFLLIEAIRRKANSQQVEMYAHMVGMVAMLLIAILITIKDVRSII